MRVKKISIVLRRDGAFHYEGREIEAVRGGDGYGVMVFLEPSSIDNDFGCHVWVPSQDELEEIQRKMKRSDRLTHDLLGHGWAGRRPFWMVHDFM